MQVEVKVVEVMVEDKWKYKWRWNWVPVTPPNGELVEIVLPPDVSHC